MKINKIVVSLCAAGVMASPLAYATNGMNLEGYGPVSQSMGGTSMAYDNGTAAMINNPATLGFMASGSSRADLALGDLMPSATSQGVDSSAKNFYMPALGYVRKVNQFAYGVGMMGQGGMGTEYANSAAFGSLNGANFAVPGAYAITDPGLKNKSEVGVGRLMFPLAYSVSPDLNVGGSIDYVWAGMDIQWLVDGTHFGDLMPTGAHNFGAINGATSTMLTPFGAAMGGGAFTSVDYGYFNFNTSSTFTQKAKGTGVAGNIGFTYKVNSKMTVGGVYHAKTSLSDMKTGTSDATMSFAVRGGGMGNAVIPLSGQVVIKNFQWPETYGIGLAYQVDDKLNVMADYKRIGWASVMKNFNMSFIADGAVTNGTFANTRMDLAYYQNWVDQNVIQLGASYKYSDAMTLRVGGNFANNPIPNAYVSPLFPAIMKTHYTAGVGYALASKDTVDASFVYAPKVTVTNNWAAAGGSNQTISLGGMSWQVMYSHYY